MTRIIQNATLRPYLKRTAFLTAAALQIGCGAVFLADIVSEWRTEQIHARIELFAVIALALGAALMLRESHTLLRRNTRVERELEAASGAFQEVMEVQFTEWGLTAAERDVALLTIKGVSISDIARMRDTREGTIKAQSTAIYRKAGVASRAELVSVMVEELISGIKSARG